MAELTVSQVTPKVNENSLIRLDFLNGETPVVLSTDVARNFQKKHQHILRDIDKLSSILPKSFNASNFGRVEVPDAKGEKRRAYLLTRDAFSLLVMGMTGKAAILWKLRYIEAFNTLEAAVAEDKANLARESAYRQGYDEGRASALPDLLDAEQRARSRTARLLWRFGPERKRRLRAAVRYRRMGLGIHDIAKLLEIQNREVSSLLDAAEALGLLPPRRERPAPVQGSLLGEGGLA